MSMSEFERQEKERGEGCPSPFIQKSEPPDDFTEEDLAFAAELHALFSPEEENLPPYYVQTLLDVDDQRFEVAPREFEQRTSARVFRRLKLRRRLFYSHRSLLGALSAGIGDRTTRRSLLAMVGAFVMVMLLTVAFTGASFVSGVAILLHGAHSGVYLTDKYPVGMVRSASPEYNWQDAPEPAVKDTTLLAAQQQMHFPLYWPQTTLQPYSLKHINFYVDLDQQWADGPMLEFEYSLPASKIAPKGMGEVWVREFKPRADALQLVQEHASTPIEMDNSGHAMAIYVDGQWDSGGKGSPVWVTGGRSELIYQLNGVIFWIVGDQRDGVGEKQLMQIAQGLTPVTVDRQFRMVGESVPVTQLSESIDGPFSTDVIVVFPDDSGDGNGPYYISVSSYQPPQHAH
jgi:hypothetical protein